jgi:FMN phosphatase YigB (HAD superfamily)
MKTTNNNITDVFFDLDHTLWDFEKNSALAFETVFKMQDVAVDMTEFLEFYVPINREYWERYLKNNCVTVG